MCSQPLCVVDEMQRDTWIMNLAVIRATQLHSHFWNDIELEGEKLFHGGQLVAVKLHLVHFEPVSFLVYLKLPGVSKFCKQFFPLK